ncbi:urocanate hydratase [Actinotalea ferrariae]|uniref:urocanate hydratase n=1 Tax=Actinotalea ferrariae TaxID=1386098 RepID=UPI001C8B3DED|nr:urocanate hydratase [Actinotalea ferrariae]MBX9243726.1 urocanate hydratase [Actinotalea ferrariae]
MECKGWLQEAALRCLRNNLHPDVAERPEDLVVYGGSGKAARDHRSLRAIEQTLTRLADDETLLVQSGKPVAVFRTFEHAPRVLLANSLLVPGWATWDHFWELEALGLTMYGQMTAGSWIYIGTQGIVQGTFQTFSALAEQRFGGTLRGKVVLTAGLGGMGGAQPLAVTMNGGTALCLDVDPARVRRRAETRYLDEIADSVDDGLRRVREAAAAGRALSVGVVANAAEALPALLARGEEVDVVTDQTSAHDPLHGYVPAGLTLDEAAELRRTDPAEYVRRARASMAEHCAAMVGFARAGAEVFDYGNNLRGEAREAGFEDAFAYPGFVPAFIRPLFCQGIGPFRLVALSGVPADVAVADDALLAAFGDNPYVQRWIPLAREKVAFQGLPARICWLGYGERAEAGAVLNDLVARGRISAPVVIGRDHLDSGSVASPYRETESMMDGSDAIADWPVLNALLNVASGAAWVAVHHGGGVGMGRSIHSGAQVVADGTADAARRLDRVLTNDPGTGVVRHADAGYEIARDVARDRGIDMPLL